MRTLPGDRGFESFSLQRKVSREPEDDIIFALLFPSVRTVFAPLGRSSAVADLPRLNGVIGAWEQGKLAFVC